ncbi:MAG: hypothetical protein KF712_05510 [Akkermansiaceae bacterium]|nr:hypothetical protein [Akkermansiaceae bacterium]
MKEVLKLMAAAALLVFSPPARGLKYPDSQDPKEFSAQVEAMILQSIDEESPIIGNYSGKRDQLVKEDTRDWESILEKIANHPEQFGVDASRQALSLAHHRGTFLKSPGMVQGAIKVFHFEKNSALQQIDESLSRGEPVSHLATTRFGGYIAMSLRTLKTLICCKRSSFTSTATMRGKWGRSKIMDPVISPMPSRNTEMPAILTKPRNSR